MATGNNGSLRIYIGGLGGNISADDLKKTFSSPQLGLVEAVEIIRTKGRSFCYLDFRPCSDKGLAKLFSTYNGCMWKGGRLRFERAKEHYLLQLRREWEEDAKVYCDPSKPVDGATGNIQSPEKFVQKHNSENVQLRIFFPKLKKVKALPFKGTGKHKYSFQRVEVPPLPTHFCDCEEHSGPPDVTKESYNQENETRGVNEEELNIMKSVMNKLFEQENVSETACGTVGFATETQITSNSVDGFQVDENPDEISDEDNLIINMVAGSDNKITTTDAWRQETFTGNEVLQVSQSRPVQKKRGDQRKNTVQSKKRLKATLDKEGEIIGNLAGVSERKGSSHDTSVDPETCKYVQTAKSGSGIQQSSYSNLPSKRFSWRDLVSGRDDGSFRLSDVIPSDHPTEDLRSKSEISDVTNQKNQRFEASQAKEVNKASEAVREMPSQEINKAVKSAPWIQNSSWRQRISGSNDYSFSISQIVPDTNSEKQELPKHEDIDSSSSKDSGQQIVMDSDFTTDSLAKSAPNQACMNLLNPPVFEKQPMRAKRTTLGDTRTQKTFTFKRSSASLKEWKMAKAAVSGSLKKKVNEKQAT